MSSLSVGPSEVTPAYIYESNIHVGNVLSTLNEQRRRGLLCDIAIIVQDWFVYHQTQYLGMTMYKGMEFKAHKAILSSCSSYFNRIITDPANISHNIVLELSSISKVGMESLLEFAYTAKLAVTCTNIDDVISAARELEFKNIEFSCLSYLKQQLNEGKSVPLLNSTEVASRCGNSKISRKDECQSSSVDCYRDEKFERPDRSVKSKSHGCPLLASLSLDSRKQKAESTTGRKCETMRCDEATKSETCDMSQEQHQAMLQQILEKHNLETVTVDDKAFDVAAMETTVCSPEPCSRLPSLQSKRNNIKKPCSSRCSNMYNSDTDEAGSADEETDLSSCSSDVTCSKLRKHPSIKLPFTMDQITSMPRSELHDLLTCNPNLTQEQISAIHEIRRRGKNRIAAQRCRKRKMECIRSLVAEIDVLRADHAALMQERRDARDQATKLADKFRAKCEKFFKCDKKKCFWTKSCGSNSTVLPPTEAPPPPQDNDTAGVNFQEHAERAYELCSKLRQAPCEDLPACPVVSTIWTGTCLSTTDSEVIVVCDASDSNDASSNPCGYKQTSCAMSPSQGLSDFGNIHISHHGRPAETKNVAASTSNSRSSVVFHTSSVENQPILDNTASGYQPPPNQTSLLHQIPFRSVFTSHDEKAAISILTTMETRQNMSEATSHMDVDCSSKQNQV